MPDEAGQALHFRYLLMNTVVIYRNVQFMFCIQICTFDIPFSIKYTENTARDCRERRYSYVNR